MKKWKLQNLKKKKKLHIKMDKKIIPFGNTEIERHKFHFHKNPTLIDDTDINKIVVSNKFSFSKKGFKHFIGYVQCFQK